MANIDIYFSQKDYPPQQSGIFSHYVVQNNNFSQKNGKILFSENFEIVHWFKISFDFY